MSNYAAAQLQHVAHLNGVALYIIIDSKVEAKWNSRLSKAGKAIIPFIDKNLLKYDYKGKVIIASEKINTYENIEVAVAAANYSANRDHYFFTFDGERDSYQGVMAILSRLTYHRMYGTGITACLGYTFFILLSRVVLMVNLRMEIV